MKFEILEFLVFDYIAKREEEQFKKYLFFDFN
jgi:hypothetical protein